MSSVVTPPSDGRLLSPPLRSAKDPPPTATATAVGSSSGLHADADSPPSAALLSPPAPHASAASPPKLVRLMTSVWPLPLQSKSTFAILLGILLLILVIIDEFVYHLWSEQQRQQQQEELAAGGERETIYESDDASSQLSQPAFILHLLRHSFTYRCLLCGVWIGGMLAQGLYLHGTYRRRGGSKKQRRGVSVTDSSASSPPTDSDPPPPRKSVTFAREELSTTGVADIVPATRLSTKKRLRLFFYLALVLAMCGIAFEFYLALVAHQFGIAAPRLASTVSNTLHTTVTAVRTISIWSVLSIVARVLMLAVWCAFCIYCAYFLWYRKAVGSRRGRGNARGASRPSISGTGSDVDDTDDEFYDSDDDDEDGDDDILSVDRLDEGDEDAEEEEDQKSEEATQVAAITETLGAAVSGPPPAALAAAAASAGTGGGSGTLSSLLPSAAYESADEASDLSSSDSDSDESPPIASFPVPSAAQLLLFEKLDASLFFHPEQRQNQFHRADMQQAKAARTSGVANGTTQKRRASLSAASSPSHARHQPASVAATPPKRASLIVSPSSSPNAPPPVSLPLSSSPMLHSTLYHLASTKFLSNMSPTDFATILPALQWKHVETGAVLYRQGDRSENATTEEDAPDAADGMYIVVSGTVGAFDPHTSSDLLSTFHQGDSIGELEFLFPHLPRALTIVALTSVQVLRIPTRLGQLWSAHTLADTQMPQSSPHHRSEETSAATDAGDAAAHVCALGEFADDSKSSLSSRHQAPRSDLLLSFVRTTLARQWRSAEFILQQFLKLPLPVTSDLYTNEEKATPTNDKSTSPSRYFTAAFDGFFSHASDLYQSLQSKSSNTIELSELATLFTEGDYRSDQLFVVLDGRVRMSTTRNSDFGEGAGVELGPGSVLNAISYFTDTNHAHTVRAASPTTRIAWLTRDDLATPHSDILRLALAVCEVLAPTLAQFQSIGFERKWVRAGTLLFKESQPCDAVYAISSGRVRIVSGKLKKMTSARRKRLSVVGAASASSPAGPATSPAKSRDSASDAPHPSGYDLSIFHDRDVYLPFQRTVAASTSSRTKPNAAKRVRFELARGELVGEVSFLNGLDEESTTSPESITSSHATAHASSALCTKDTELIKMSRACFERLVRAHPRVSLKIAQILANRLKDLMSGSGGAAAAANGAEPRASVLSSIPRSPFLHTPTSSAAPACMSVCLFSADPGVDLHHFALHLSLSLSGMGRTMLVTSNHVDRVLGAGTCADLNSYSTRSLFTYWLSHVEAQYAFCLCVCDSDINPWTLQCQRQADLTLIVANADDAIEDDADEEEVSDPIEAAKMMKRRMRAKRVSHFEKIGVWNAGQRESTVLQQQQRQRQRHHRKTSSTSETLGQAAAVSSVTAAAASASLCYPRMHFSLRDLVLLHPPTSTSPHGTRFWCAARPSLHRYHHVATGYQEPFERRDASAAPTGDEPPTPMGADGESGAKPSSSHRPVTFVQEHIDRLARYIAGKTVGMVLSGGGARGLAHLGVLTNFAEQNVPIDFVGGTSQGSFMAALYASQPYHHTLALQQMKVRVHALAESMGSIASLLTDATFPMLAYFAGRKFGLNISNILGLHTRIEDLWLPYFAVTTNLSQADMYTNNLPVDVCHALFQPCYVIGVDVENRTAEEKIAHTSYYGPHLSGWWLLKTRMYEWIRAGWTGRTIRRVKRAIMRTQATPEEQEMEPLNFPKFAELVSSLIYINHARNLRQSFDSTLISLYLRPELGATALLDYHLESQIVDIGYSCARQKLTEWRLRNSAHLPKATPTTEEMSAASTAASGAAITMQRTSSSIAIAAAATTVASSPAMAPVVGSATPLARRKNSVTHRAVLAPASLTFTHELGAPRASSGETQANGDKSPRVLDPQSESTSIVPDAADPSAILPPPQKSPLVTASPCSSQDDLLLVSLGRPARDTPAPLRRMASETCAE